MSFFDEVMSHSHGLCRLLEFLAPLVVLHLQEQHLQLLFLICKRSPRWASIRLLRCTANSASHRNHHSHLQKFLHRLHNTHCPKFSHTDRHVLFIVLRTTVGFSHFNLLMLLNRNHETVATVKAGRRPLSRIRSYVKSQN